MYIGKLATYCGVHVETIRYYQRRGLLPTPTKSHGYRTYSSEDIRRVKWIRRAQSAGFTLTEIGELLASDAKKEKSTIRTLTLARIEQLDRKIEELTTARRSLMSLLAQCDDRHEQCPILDAFEDEKKEENIQ